MYTNQNFYEYHKLELYSSGRMVLSIKIEGNKIFPESFFVNMKEAFGMFLITL